jgi:hypothetical protein
VGFTGAHLNVSNNANAGAIAVVENNSTGNSAYTTQILAQDVGSNLYAEFIRYNSGASGNVPGTSIPLAESTTINNYSGSATPAKPIGFTGNFLFFGSGNTSTNLGFRSDATGFRIGQMSTLHNANTAAFEVTGSVKLNGLTAPPSTYNVLVHDLSDSAVYQVPASTLGINLKGSTTWDPASIGANSSTSTSFTVTGAAVGDPVTISKTSGSYSNGEIYFAYVSATNTVTIQLQNGSGGSFDITSATFNVTVFKH